MRKKDFFGKRSLLYTSSSSLFVSDYITEKKEVSSINNSKLMGKVTGNELTLISILLLLLLYSEGFMIDVRKYWDEN